VTPPVLELSGVVKDYRGLRPLRIEHLIVGAGERVALLGFDQAMAEVFINLVTGATLPDKGVVAAFGRSTADIADAADWLAAVDRFGIVSERAVLLDQLSGLQNLAMPFTVDIEPPPPDVAERARKLAREVGLSDAGDHHPIAALDAAARLRIRLGRAIALDPSVLLIEHASAGLSPAAAAAFGADAQAVASHRGAALVALTADRAFARAVASRVLTLEPATGGLKEQGTRRWFGRSLG
jgi:predicted ABC-type transport system involved in lysophospholipase L1 biosynthesis ATPase subunit